MLASLAAKDLQVDNIVVKLTAVSVSSGSGGNSGNSGGGGGSKPSGGGHKHMRWKTITFSDAWHLGKQAACYGAKLHNTNYAQWKKDQDAFYANKTAAQPKSKEERRAKLQR